jgi:hypothetical protein
LEIERPQEPKQSNVINLMDALRQSLETESGEEEVGSHFNPQAGSGQASRPEEGKLIWLRRAASAGPLSRSTTCGAVSESAFP